MLQDNKYLEYQKYADAVSDELQNNCYSTARKCHEHSIELIKSQLEECDVNDYVAYFHIYTVLKIWGENHL